MFVKIKNHVVRADAILFVGPAPADVVREQAEIGRVLEVSLIAGNECDTSNFAYDTPELMQVDLDRISVALLELS
jgi:hypothetical protein